MNNPLKEYPTVIELPIAWGEMDAFQHVNNIFYFRYFENARLAYFEKLDYLKIRDETGVGPILASTQCRFKFPVTYPDTVSVGARTTHIGKDRFLMKHCVYSQRHERIAAEGEGLIVSYDYRKNKKAPVPELLREHIIEMEKSVGNPPLITL